MLMLYLLVIHTSNVFGIGKMSNIMKLKLCQFFLKKAPILSLERKSQKEGKGPSARGDGNVVTLSKENLCHRQ